MNTWRTLGLVALALLIAWVLYPRAETLKDNAGREELTLWGPISVSESLRTAVEEFERSHPTYTVRIGAAAVKDENGDPTRFLLSVAGGSPPDVIVFDRFAVVEMAARGAFRELNGYLDADKKRIDGVHQEDFFAPMWKEPQWQGKQYAIPTDCDTRALYVNQDMLVRGGFVDDNNQVVPPKTWEQMCKKIFHGHGSVNGDVVHLAAPMKLPGLLRTTTGVAEGEIPVSRNADASLIAPRVDDVVTLRSGTQVFRARIREVLADGGLRLDFTRELPPGTQRVPAAITSDSQMEVKVFSGDSYAVKLTKYNENGDVYILGFSPLDGNSWLYLYAWENGGELLSDDGRTCTMDSPENMVALQYMADVYDALGGLARVAKFNDLTRGSPLQPFLAGRTAMKIDGNWFLDTIAQFKPDLRFEVVPAPMPEARLKAGATPITWGGGFSYAIPATAKHQDAAWELIRFLMTPRVILLQAEVESGRRAAGHLFVPDFSARQDVTHTIRDTYMKPVVNDRMLAAYDAFVALLPDARFRPVTPVGQQMWVAQTDAQTDGTSHVRNIRQSLEVPRRKVQEDLDTFYHPPTGPVVNWDYFVWGYAALVAAIMGLLLLVERRYRERKLGKRDLVAGFTSVSPWLIGFIVFGGGPLLFSLIISFCNYDVLNPARFVGFFNYWHVLGWHRDPLTHVLVANDADLWLSLGNTLFMMLGVPLGIIGGLLLAMLLNQSFKGIAFFRTIYFLPSIVPSIASFLLWIWIFDPVRGVLNASLMSMGVHNPPNWLGEPGTWAKPAIIIMGLWGVGGGMLIWLAGLKNVPTTLYEAAEIDGAGLFRRFWNVTLPMLSPYIFFNTIMGVIGSLQTFESAFVMTQGGPNKQTLFFAFRLFNEAFRYFNMGTASAMAWILFLLVLGLTLLQSWMGKKWVHYD